MASNAATLSGRIRDSLKDVIDPELGRDIVSLGLIYGIEASEEGVVHITMTTTVPGCPAAGFIVDAVRFASSTVEGVNSTAVHLIYEPRWRPEMISA
jgi:metal-sulfur cluster biosynthetic enzyme